MSARTVRVIAWGSLVLAITFGVLAISLTVDNGGAPPGTDTIESGVVGTSVLVLVVLSFSIVGSIIATRRPDNWLGWLFCADGLLISFQNFAGTYAAFHGTASSPGTLPGAVWFSLLDDALWIPFLFMTTAFLFLLFPDGRPASRRDGRPLSAPPSRPLPRPSSQGCSNRRSTATRTSPTPPGSGSRRSLPDS